MELCPTARNFFARRSQFDAGILDVLQGKLAKHGEKSRRLGMLTCFKQALVEKPESLNASRLSGTKSPWLIEAPKVCADQLGCVSSLGAGEES